MCSHIQIYFLPNLLGMAKAQKGIVQLYIGLFPGTNPPMRQRNQHSLSDKNRNRNILFTVTSTYIYVIIRQTLVRWLLFTVNRASFSFNYKTSNSNQLFLQMNPRFHRRKLYAPVMKLKDLFCYQT